MRILLVTFGLPYPPDSGVRIRDFHLLRELSRHAEVSLLSLLTVEPGDGAGRLRAWCRTVETIPMTRRSPVRHLADFLHGRRLRLPLATHPFYFPEAAALIRRLVAARPPDIVQIEHSFLSCYRPAVPEGGPWRTVLSLHNIGSRQYARISKLDWGPADRLSFFLKARLMRGWEARMAARFDHTIVVSAEEAGLLTAQNPGLPISIVENGVDCELIQPLGEPGGGNHLLFVGVMNYPPNRDAMLYFCRSVLPLVLRQVPGVRLTIAGHAPPPEVQRLASPCVRVTGPVRDVMAFYRDVAVSIAPLRAGGGTRLKILEAMAAGRPVVSTSIGCEGLEVTPDRHLLLADTPETFAAATVRLLREPALRASLAANARRHVLERYDWRVIGRRLAGVYEDLLRGSGER
jgi:glycosyltransferase involved in cell wall biosynthesis